MSHGLLLFETKVRFRQIAPPRTWINRLSFNPRRPVTAVASSRYLEVFCGQLDVVRAILDDLYATLACVILSPAVRVKAVALVACMTRFCCLA